MYNPYNWEIKSEFSFDESILKKSSLEDNQSYYNRLMSEFAKWSARRSIQIIGIQLAEDNLNDSLKRLINLNEGYDTCVHDMEILKRRIDEYQHFCVILEKIDKQVKKLLE